MSVCIGGGSSPGEGSLDRPTSRSSPTAGEHHDLGDASDGERVALLPDHLHCFVHQEVVEHRVLLVR